MFVCLLLANMQSIARALLSPELNAARTALATLIVLSSLARATRSARVTELEAESGQSSFNEQKEEEIDNVTGQFAIAQVLQQGNDATGQDMTINFLNTNTISVDTILLQNVAPFQDTSLAVQSTGCVWLPLPAPGDENLQQTLSIGNAANNDILNVTSVQLQVINTTESIFEIKATDTGVTIGQTSGTHIVLPGDTSEVVAFRQNPSTPCTYECDGIMLITTSPARPIRITDCPVSVISGPSAYAMLLRSENALSNPFTIFSFSNMRSPAGNIAAIQMQLQGVSNLPEISAVQFDFVQPRQTSSIVKIENTQNVPVVRGVSVQANQCQDVLSGVMFNSIGYPQQQQNNVLVQISNNPAPIINLVSLVSNTRTENRGIQIYNSTVNQNLTQTFTVLSIEDATTNSGIDLRGIFIANNECAELSALDVFSIFGSSDECYFVLIQNLVPANSFSTVAGVFVDEGGKTSNAVNIIDMQINGTVAGNSQIQSGGDCTVNMGLSNLWILNYGLVPDSNINVTFQLPTFSFNNVLYLAGTEYTFVITPNNATQTFTFQASSSAQVNNQSTYIITPGTATTNITVTFLFDGANFWTSSLGA